MDNSYIDKIDQNVFEQEVASTYALLDNLQKEYEIYCYYEQHHLIMEDVQNQTNSSSENNNNDNPNNNNQNIFQKIWNGFLNILKLIGQAIKAFWMVLTKKTPSEKFMIDMYKRMDQNQLEQNRTLIKKELESQIKSSNNQNEENVKQEFAAAVADETGLTHGAAGAIEDTINAFRQGKSDIDSGMYSDEELRKRTIRNTAKTFGNDLFGSLIGTSSAAALLSALGIATTGPAGVFASVVAGAILHYESQKVLDLLFDKVIPPSETKRYLQLPELDKIINGGESIIQKTTLMQKIAFESNHNTSQDIKKYEMELGKMTAAGNAGEGALNFLSNWANYVKNNSAFKDGANSANTSQSILNDEKNAQVYADALTFDIDSSTPTNDQKVETLIKTLNNTYYTLNNLCRSAVTAMRQNQNEFKYMNREYVIHPMITKMQDPKNSIINKMIDQGKKCLEYLGHLKFIQEIGKFWASLYGNLVEKVLHRDKLQKMVNAGNKNPIPRTQNDPVVA